MARPENQTKIVLDEDQIETLREALVIATAWSHAEAEVAQLMNHQEAADHYRKHARTFQELLTYSPEVVRVAVTVEVPDVAHLRSVQ